MSKWLDEWRERLDRARYGDPVAATQAMNEAVAKAHSFKGVWTVYRVRLGIVPTTYPAIPVCTTWDERDAELLYALLKAAEERKRVPRWHFWIETGEPKETVAPLHRGQGAHAE